MTRIVAIVFPHLMTDWILRRQPTLKKIPFALAIADRGRRVVKAVNILAQIKGVNVNMVVADCKAIVPELEVLEYDPEQPRKLLAAIAEWCIRYAPSVAVDLPDGILLDVSGCTHLWGSEEEYLKNIYNRFKIFGYNTQIAIADTVGCAWAVCRFSPAISIIGSKEQAKAISSLSPAALRIEDAILDRLNKLGLQTVGNFMTMPRTALRRRFGTNLLMRLDQGNGNNTRKDNTNKARCCL